MSTSRPSLTFFCEMDSQSLVGLFSDQKVIKQLINLHANVSLGLLDFSDDRAKVVRRLTHSGIPVTAWLLLPKEKGYWTNLDTIEETRFQYDRFKVWTKEEKLDWAAIGLDIEPKLQIMARLGANFWREFPVLLKRYTLGNYYHQKELELISLINKIRVDGFAVETYQFPTVIDERKVSSHIFARLFGIPAVQSDREVLMLYSSFFPTKAQAILQSYMTDSKSVGLGSTGGGVAIAGMPELRSLRWLELKRDLLTAAKNVENIYIFSLEGCVEKDFLEKLINLNWEDKVSIPYRSAAGIKLLRKWAQGFLWVLSHPAILIFAAVLGLILKRNKSQ